MTKPAADLNPPLDCEQCPRLAAFRNDNAVQYPEYFNAPAPSFGDPDPQLLIVGLAPGLHGANKTGRPFTGDYAGDLLYAALDEYGFSKGVYDARPDDGLQLVKAMITNAVRCVPPQNKPNGQEIKTCRSYLKTCLETLPNLKAVICLGRIAHESTIAALGLRQKAAPFAHGAEHEAPGNSFSLFDSYHCSRYNTNTGRLTQAMFFAVFAAARKKIDN